MAQMSSDGERKGVKYGDSLQLTNWVLDSGSTCNMTPEVKDFIPGSLEDTDKYIEVADGNHVTAKQKGQVQRKMCDNNGKTFISTLYNVILASDRGSRYILSSTSSQTLAVSPAINDLVNMCPNI